MSFKNCKQNDRCRFIHFDIEMFEVNVMNAFNLPGISGGTCDAFVKVYAQLGDVRRLIGQTEVFPKSTSP